MRSDALRPSATGCLFATHLHEIFALLDARAAGPLPSLRRVCLGVEPRADGGVAFLYTLQVMTAAAPNRVGHHAPPHMLPPRI